jgi:transcriptional regulator with XRE-family HTH domain
MNEQIRLISERIRDLREISGISAETIAKELGVPANQYLEYEHGNSDMPIGFLYKIAQRYNIELSAILSGENPRLHVFCVARKGKALRIERKKPYMYESLANNFIQKKAEPLLVTIDPEPENSPLENSAHPGQEFDYVLQGTLKITIDGHEIILNEGDSIYFDSQYDHSVKALNDMPVKILAIVI